MSFVVSPFGDDLVKLGNVLGRDGVLATRRRRALSFATGLTWLSQ